MSAYPQRRYGGASRERTAAIIALRRGGATYGEIRRTLGLDLSKQALSLRWQEHATPDDRAAYEAARRVREDERQRSVLEALEALRSARRRNRA